MTREVWTPEKDTSKQMLDLWRLYFTKLNNIFTSNRYRYLDIRKRNSLWPLQASLLPLRAMVSCISRTRDFWLKISAKRCGLYTSFYGTPQVISLLYAFDHLHCIDDDDGVCVVVQFYPWYKCFWVIILVMYDVK